MHPDIERAQFIEHLTKLRQENERLALVPARDETYLATLKAKLERSEAQNAILRARLTAYQTPEPAVPKGRGGCRIPGSGLGTLTGEQVADMHRRQLDIQAIAAAAGVHHSSVSRWRKANGYIYVWMPREEACGSLRMA